MGREVKWTKPTNLFPLAHPLDVGALAEDRQLLKDMNTIKHFVCCHLLEDFIMHQFRFKMVRIKATTSNERHALTHSVVDLNSPIASHSPFLVTVYQINRHIVVVVSNIRREICPWHYK